MFEYKVKSDLIKKIKKLITNKPLNWLEEAISKDYIKYYEYESFKNVQIVGQGHFGKVFRANYKDTGQYFALKSFSNLNAATIKEIVHEVSEIKTIILVSLLVSFFLFLIYDLHIL
jgi:hypothetical protein